jgi:isoleucyl-tRNA synthetase
MHVIGPYLEINFGGTPIPIWANDDLSEMICIGSIEQLQQETGMTNITDLHRDPKSYPPCTREWMIPMMLSRKIDMYDES